MFIDKLDHKPTIHRISTNTPQKELHRIDLQENRGELRIEIQRERRCHLANNYGPEGLWYTAGGIHIESSFVLVSSCNH